MPFADTSALLKLYLFEEGSQWMRTEIRPQGLAISDLAVAEVGVSLSRRVLNGHLPPQDARAAWRIFRRDVRSFLVARIDQRSLVGAGLLAARSSVPLRTLDAIQLHGASEFAVAAQRLGDSAPLFVSADLRLLAAAQAHGFVTANPRDHS